MPGTALWAFICLPLSPSLDAWRGSLGGRVHLSTFVSQHVWHPFVSLHLSPVVSQPGCLALFFWWTDSLFSLSLPSFGSCCLPAWMSVTALQAWHGSLGGQFRLSPFTCSRRTNSLLCLGSPSPISVGGRIDLSLFVSLYLSPIVSQPGCPSGWTDAFVSRCLPAWMCGTHAPRFPSLPAVLSFWRGLVCLRLRPWLRSFLVLWMLGTGSSVCPSSGLRFCLGRLPCLSLATPCLFVQCLVISCGLSLSLLAFGVPS